MKEKYYKMDLKRRPGEFPQGNCPALILTKKLKKIDKRPKSIVNIKAN
jgi:hypothetical protein